MIGKLAYKLGLAALLLVAVLFASNAIYSKYFFKKDVLDAKGKALFDLDSLQHQCDVLYFGESSDLTTAWNDTCQWSISQMVDSLSPKKVGRVSTAAAHAATYLQLIKNIAPDSPVKTIIVTLNLRSFGAAWINSPLETPLMKTNVLYKPIPPILRRLQVAFNGYDNTTDDWREERKQWHWQHDKINVPDTFRQKTNADWAWAIGADYVSRHLNPDSTVNNQKVELARHYVKGYGFSIDVNTNPRIADFDAIVAWAQKRKINVVFNLLAENMQYADSLVGPVLTSVMQQNRDLLVKRYTQPGVIVVDNLYAVPNGLDFTDQNWTTEHYNQRGRWAIAHNVVEKASVWLK